MPNKQEILNVLSSAKTTLQWVFLNSKDQTIKSVIELEVDKINELVLKLSKTDDDTGALGF